MEINAEAYVVPDTVIKWDLLATVGMHWEQYQFAIKGEQ
jgi:hypothetical protein